MVTTKKKILIVSHVPTHPQDAGNKRRIFENVELLREMGYEIDFLYYRSGLSDDIKSMKQYFGNGHFRLLPCAETSYFNRVKHQLREILDKTNLDKRFVLHYDIDERYDQSIAKVAISLHKKRKYNFVMVEYVMYSKVLEEFDENVVKIIDTHDKFSEREKLFQERGEKPSFFYTTLRQERKGLSRADIVIAIQNEEKKFFSKLLKGTNTKVYTIGQRIKAIELPLNNKPVIGFIGSDNALNQGGFWWFIKYVFPKIKKQIPDIKFKIAGSICKCIPVSNLYEKLGMVDHVEDFYFNVRLIINPVTAGTGLNIKSIEAIAHMKPMVTTSVGAKGLESDENIFLVSDDEQEFANMICKLIISDEECNSLICNCKRFIKQYNSEIANAMNKMLN